MASVTYCQYLFKHIFAKYLFYRHKDKYMSAVRSVTREVGNNDELVAIENMTMKCVEQMVPVTMYRCKDTDRIYLEFKED